MMDCKNTAYRLLLKNIYAVQYTSEREKMTKLDKVATSHSCNFVCVFFVTVRNNSQKTLTKLSRL